MPASLPADRPRHSRIARFTTDRVIPTLSIRLTDWMNRRKIEDVESHCLCILHARQAITEGRSMIAAALG